MERVGDAINRRAKARAKRSEKTKAEAVPTGPIRKYPKRSWFQVTFVELFEPPYELTLKPAMLMGLLHNLADMNASKGEERACSPGNKWMSEQMHESVDSIRRHVKELERLNLLKVERSDNSAHTYRPQIPEHWCKEVEVGAALPF